MAILSVANINNGQVFSPPNNEVATANRAAAAVNTQPAVAQKAPVTKAEPAASNADVQQAADKINKALRNLVSSNLEFSVDQDSGQTIVRVVDIETKDVIRQIPNEETVAIAKSLDKLQGLLIQQKA